MTEMVMQDTAAGESLGPIVLIISNKRDKDVLRQVGHTNPVTVALYGDNAPIRVAITDEQIGYEYLYLDTMEMVFKVMERHNMTPAQFLELMGHGVVSPWLTDTLCQRISLCMLA